MGKNKYNQFIKTQMRQNQPDREKLIHIASFMRQEFNLTVQREAILTFDRQKDEHLVGFSSWLTEEQYKKYTIHVPDLLFFVGQQLWILEIDGYVHNTNATVAKKDIERDRIYTAASKVSNLKWLKINEWEVLIKLGHKPDRSATAKEVITEVKKVVGSIVKEYQDSLS